MNKIAFVFPGQGAQKIGMGQDFYENSPAAKEIFDKASDSLSMDMNQICFEENDKLNLTEYTQAALVTTCMAIFTAVSQIDIKADVTAGLSLGEYCAIAAAEGMSFEDAVIAVRKRGILMQRAVPAGKGAMAAVLGLNGSEVEAVINRIDDVYVANYNCPGQVVITGIKEAVYRARDELIKSGAKRVVELNVSGPFHSPMLQEAGKELEKVLDTIRWNNLKIPYVTNVTGKYIDNIDKTKDLLVKQISQPVMWQQGVNTMLSEGVNTFIEIGPGKTLAGFIRKIDKNAAVYNVEAFEDLKKLEQINN